MYGKVPGSIAQIEHQLKVDRTKDSHCITSGMSLFRVPESFRRSAAKIEWAANFIVRTAQADHEAKRARVYYLDYEKTYKRINNFAAAHPSVLQLSVVACSDGVFHTPDQK